METGQVSTNHMFRALKAKVKSRRSSIIQNLLDNTILRNLGYKINTVRATLHAYGYKLNF